MIAFAKAAISRTVPFKWLKYSYRYYTEESALKFGQWLARMEWQELYCAEGSNRKAEIYQAEVVGALEACFPLIQMKRKSSDPPCINWKIRKKLRQRNGIYMREGRSPKWRRLKRVTDRMIEKRRSKYIVSQKDALLAKDGDRNFF